MVEKLNANARAVLEVVRAAPRHPTAAEIYRGVTALRPNMGLASVYRILHRLVEQGYIREFRHSDESCRYDAHIERHDHAICTVCGRLFDVPLDIAPPREQLQAAAQATDLELDSYEVRLYGRCSACREPQNTTSQVS